ncbi:HAD family hydrolase [Rouxiella sp. Mn2063]|uniref:HAD family hydrolase n=1 Tax=Rouxiella sp. Mn2063 TaxID=3395262 RepID=UPI003BE8A408
MSLALFDLDETLISCDCSSEWSNYMIKQGWVEDKRAFLQRNEELIQQYALGEMDLADYMHLTLAPLRGRRQQDVAQLINQFVEEIIAPCVYPAAWECLAQHRANGDRIVIISASGEHLVTPIARYLGVDESLSIGVVIQEACFTGAIQGVMSYREGKVTRLLELLNQDKTQLRHASFYSDSNNDLPLLSQVGHPIVVNPDAILLQHAQQAGWPVYRWS